MNQSNNISVLFVCMGNICRSPAGEGVFQDYIEKHNLHHLISVDSAGTHAYHVGNNADARMRDSASQRGYQLLSIARQVNRDDIDQFDLIVAMDDDNFHGLVQLAGEVKSNIKLLGSFLDGRTDDTAPSVPDPYYGGQEGFEKVLDMIEEACPAMLQYCQDLLNSKHV